MKTFIWVLIWMSAYCSVGATFSHFKIIEEPAWWALFGAVSTGTLFLVLTEGK